MFQRGRRMSSTNNAASGNQGLRITQPRQASVSPAPRRATLSPWMQRSPSFMNDGGANRWLAFSGADPKDGALEARLDDCVTRAIDASARMQQLSDVDLELVRNAVAERHGVKRPSNSVPHVNPSAVRPGSTTGRRMEPRPPTGPNTARSQSAGPGFLASDDPSSTPLPIHMLIEAAGQMSHWLLIEDPFGEDGDYDDLQRLQAKCRESGGVALMLVPARSIKLFNSTLLANFLQHIEDFPTQADVERSLRGIPPAKQHQLDPTTGLSEAATADLRARPQETAMMYVAPAVQILLDWSRALGSYFMLLDLQHRNQLARDEWAAIRARRASGSGFRQGSQASNPDPDDDATRRRNKELEDELERMRQQLASAGKDRNDMQKQLADAHQQGKPLGNTRLTVERMHGFPRAERSFVEVRYPMDATEPLKVVELSNDYYDPQPIRIAPRKDIPHEFQRARIDCFERGPDGRKGAKAGYAEVDLTEPGRFKAGVIGPQPGRAVDVLVEHDVPDTDDDERLREMFARKAAEDEDRARREADEAAARERARAQEELDRLRKEHEDALAAERERARLATEDAEAARRLAAEADRDKQRLADQARQAAEAAEDAARAAELARQQAAHAADRDFSTSPAAGHKDAGKGAAQDAGKDAGPFAKKLFGGANLFPRLPPAVVARKDTEPDDQDAFHLTPAEEKALADSFERELDALRNRRERLVWIDLRRFAPIMTDARCQRVLDVLHQYHSATLVLVDLRGCRLLTPRFIHGPIVQFCNRMPVLRHMLLDHDDGLWSAPTVFRLRGPFGDNEQYRKVLKVAEEAGKRRAAVLDLRGKGVRDEAARVVGFCIQNSAKLSVVDLRDNDLTDASVQRLVEVLRSSDNEVSAILLDGNRCVSRAAHMAAQRAGTEKFRLMSAAPHAPAALRGGPPAGHRSPIGARAI